MKLKNIIINTLRVINARISAEGEEGRFKDLNLNNEQLLHIYKTSKKILERYESISISKDGSSGRGKYYSKDFDISDDKDKTQIKESVLYLRLNNDDFVDNSIEHTEKEIKNQSEWCKNIDTFYMLLKRFLSYDFGTFEIIND